MKEIRSIEASEFRVIPESRLIEGYALLFNTESRDLGGFKEIITPQALNGVLEQSDVYALYNHQDNKVLARNTNGKGTLSLNVDERGLKYSFIAPSTSLGDEVYDAIKRGDLRNSSFAFNVSKSGEKWEKRNGENIRVITQFNKLFDVSPVFSPAYSDTTVAVRSLKEFNDEERQEIKVEITICDEKTDDIVDKMPIEQVLEPISVEEAPIEEIPQEDTTIEPLPVEEVPQEENLVDFVYDGEDLSVPQEIKDEIDKLLEPYVAKQRKLKEYFEKLEQSILELKK